MTSNAISIRPFRHGDDATLARLQHADEAAVHRWLGQPNLDPERDCVFAEVGGRPVGYGYLVVEPAISRGVLLPGTDWDAKQEVLKALLDACSENARRLGLSHLQVDVPERATEDRATYEAAGMAHVRTHLHLMRYGATKSGVPLPERGSTRLATRDDVEAITDLQNSAFTGSWGYSPNTPEEIEYRIFELPSDPPDPVVLLEIGGELVGYCWAHRELNDPKGVIGMVGVWPDRQGEGLGKAATAAGLDHLIDHGADPVEITVDSENGPAVHVYESLGFAVEWRSVWYERQLG